MLFVLVFLYLAIKHVLTAHVWDVGYSRSRRRIERWWYVYHCYQLAIEVTVSLPLYIVLTPELMVVGTAMELVVLSLGALLERKAPYPLMLVIHIACELCLLMTYAVIAALVVSYHPW